MKTGTGNFVAFFKWTILCSLSLPLFMPLSLPYPYDFLEVQSITEYYSNESAFNSTNLSPAEYAKYHGAPILELGEATTTQLFKGQIFGAESVTTSITSQEHQQLVMIDKYGFVRIASYDSDAKSFQLSNTSLYVGPGRSLGFHMRSSDEMIVCDSLKGLLAVNISDLHEGETTGDRIRVLTNAVTSQTWQPSNAINYANDLDLSKQDSHDIVYFTSSTTLGVVAFNSEDRYYDTMRSFVLTWLAGDVSGRLLAYNMTSRQTSMLMQNLYYANGVAVAADNSFVLVVETVGLRVWKYFLTGSKRGSKEVFIEQLPGFPDGISRSQDGKSFLISLVAPLSPLFSTGNRAMQSPLARWMSAWVLVKFAPLLTKVGILRKLGCVLQVTAAGEVTEMLLDPSGATVSTISAVTETDDQLLFGNLGGDSIFLWDKSKR